MATSPWDDTPPTVGERYQSASRTSDLSVSSGPLMPVDHRATPTGDVVAAAGLAACRLAPDGKGGFVLLPVHDASMGMSLMRLDTEWTNVAKPNRPGPEVVVRLAEQIKRQDARDRETAKRNETAYVAPKPAFERAQDEIQRWYTNEVRLVAVRLKSRRAVVEHLTAWGAGRGIASEDVARGLLHWLDPTCHHCNGHGLRFLEHQAVRQCTRCHGGEKETDPQMDRVIKQINYALDQARGSLRKRLRRG